MEHEQELCDLAQQASALAQRIRPPDWGSGAPGGGFQTRVNVELPKAPPDAKLMNVVTTLESLVRAIREYLPPKPPS
jgi:hypothetical protein